MKCYIAFGKGSKEACSGGFFVRRVMGSIVGEGWQGLVSGPLPAFSVGLRLRGSAMVSYGFQTAGKSLSNGPPEGADHSSQMPSPKRIRNSFRNSFRNSIFRIVKNEMCVLGIHLGIHFCDIDTPLRRGLTTRKGAKMAVKRRLSTPLCHGFGGKPGG